MNTRVEKPSMEVIKEAGDLLRAGKVVAIPTETVYGLGANALDVEAIKKIFEIKGRPMDNPLIVHIADKVDIDKYAYTNDIAKNIINAFWPGPLTIVLKKRDIIPLEISAGLDTVAIRMPGNEVALNIIKSAGVPIAAPSANLSGKPSPTSAEHVKHDLDGRVELVIDGGKCSVGLESTVLDLSSEKAIILRPGKISANDLEKFVQADISSSNVQVDEIPKAPGMKYRHYAPKAEIIIIQGKKSKVINEINEQLKNSLFNAKKLGVIIESGDRDKIEAEFVYSLDGSLGEESIARDLFSALRALDDDNIDIAFVPALNEKGIGKASMNRLLKAANYKIKRV